MPGAGHVSPGGLGFSLDDFFEMKWRGKPIHPWRYEQVNCSRSRTKFNPGLEGRLEVLGELLAPEVGGYKLRHDTKGGG